MKADKGSLAEEAVVEMIRWFIAQKTVFKYNHRIVACIRAHKNDSSDQAGVDVWVIFNTGLAMPVQVGTSSHKHRQHQRKHPCIKFVFVIKKLPQNQCDRRRFRYRLSQLINNALSSDRLCV